MNGCEGYRILISASLDEELTIEDRLLLESHLAECAACRDREAAFERVNDLLRSRHPQQTPVELVPQRQARRRSILDHIRWISVTAAVALIMFTVAAVLTQSRTATAGPLIEPLTEVQEISAHRRATQDTVLQTLEWELRALRLDLAGVEVDVDQREQLSSRLNALLDRVETAQQRSQLSGD